MHVHCLTDLYIVQVGQNNSQADAQIVRPPWYRLAHTLSIRQLQFVDDVVVLLVVCPVGPLPVVPGVPG